MVKKLVPVILKAAIVATVAWLLFSFVDIAVDNTNAAPVHSDYNLFIMLEEATRK